MDRHLLVCTEGRCFAGKLVRAGETEGILLKQSEKSGIMVRIPMELCSYLIHISGKKAEEPEQVRTLLREMMAEE